jgi:hypothetical protein
MPETPMISPRREQVVVGVRRLVLGREGRIELTTDDQREELVVGDAVDGSASAQLAVAEDGHALGELAHLGEPVRDVHDGGAVGRGPTDAFEEEVDGVRAQRRRGLVEDEERGTDDERLRELEQVTLGDAEQPDAVVEVGARADVGEHRAHAGGLVVALAEELGGHRHADVLGDGHVRQHGRVLVDDRDAEAGRLGGGEPVDELAAYGDRAGVGRGRAGGDAHEGGLAGTVLPQQGVDLARADVERHVGQRCDAVVVLADSRQDHGRLGDDGRGVLSHAFIPHSRHAVDLVGWRCSPGWRECHEPAGGRSRPAGPRAHYFRSFAWSAPDICAER